MGVPGPTIAYRPAPAPQKPGKGYVLPLSAQQHAALLRLLDWTFTDRPDGNLLGLLGIANEDGRLLRAIRSRLKRTTP